MKRRRAGNLDSLELLLDAICNTFGAVLFISMLVAILVSQSTPSGPEGTKAPQETVTEAKLKVQQVEEQIRQLKQIQQQQQEVSERFASEESLRLANEIQESFKRRVQLMSEKTDATKSMAEAGAETVLLQVRLMQQQSTLNEAQSQNEELQKKLDQLKLKKSRTARIPRLRKTTRQPFVYVIDDGRLFQFFTASLTFNKVDCEQHNSGGTITLTPRSGAGLLITESMSQDVIENKFQDVSASRHFVQLFVSRDSFAEFLPVKDALVNLGIEYETVIAAEEDVELTVGEQQRESFVQ